MAKAGTPEAHAVASSYSNSLLGAAPVASQPHPDRKSVLVEANALFLNDMLGVGMMLQRGLRQGYGLDRGNSVITAVRGVRPGHRSSRRRTTSTPPTSRCPARRPARRAARRRCRATCPTRAACWWACTTRWPRCPQTPMATRRADPRVGLFTSTVLDFSDDLQLSPRQRYVNRWRLEKKDPAAAMSEPVKPITFWIDRNVPLAYRETVRAAILEWNKAFEKIGFTQRHPRRAAARRRATSTRWTSAARRCAG